MNLITGSRGRKEGRTNCAGKTLAENLNRSLLSYLVHLVGAGGPGLCTAGSCGCLGSERFLAGPWKAGVEGIIIILCRKRQLSFSDGLLPGQVSAEAAEEPDATQGRRRHQGGRKSLTCGEGGGGDAAPLGVLGRLQEHRVVCALRQALQSYPRVLRIHNQLLWDKRRREVERAEQRGHRGGQWGREVQTPRSVLQWPFLSSPSHIM